MSIDAIALMPRLGELRGEPMDGWELVDAPGGARGIWKPLRDGALVGLGLPFQYPDATLYEAARGWLPKKKKLAKVWVFPDTAVPELETAEEIRTATAAAGRWVKAGARQRSLLEDLGFTADEAEAWQRDIQSGNPTRLAAAHDRLKERVERRDPKDVEALMAAFLSKVKR